MKIVDCFTFLNELELLDLRLMTLNNVVDHFVLVEANKTHTGKPKEFIFEANKDRFKQYLDKIMYVKVKDLPDYEDSKIWIPENFQRNCISRVIKGRFTNNDRIIISDIDEIPNPDVIVAHKTTPSMIVFEQKLFYYYVNCRQNQVWHGSIMDFYNPRITPQQLRHTARGLSHGVPGKFNRIRNVIRNGGWHYSFMGGAEQIKYKVENIAESRFIIDRVGTLEDIKSKVAAHSDLWNRTDDYARKTIINVNKPGMAPKCIGDFIRKYPHFHYGDYE